MNSNLADLTDQELLELVRKADQPAFVCIYRRYWSELYRCAFRIFPNQQTCEELIHDVFLYLWDKGRHTHIQSLKDYLYIAVKNRALNQVRAENNLHRMLGSVPTEAISSLAAEEKLNCQEINRIYDEAVAELPDKCRTILLMSRHQHLSNKEIAAQLNIAPKTVENQITIGLRHIRLRLGEYLIILLSIYTHL
ncbi:RNA polymerase sigma-70 factor [Chitinophaga sp. sic0106]|uniref:RNA polymerase sigma-70 factor n=1 Tax=Chitinophaga sp. sic0106 TaxID=2854785 RepID=UPI001C4677A7|nr:RNA polymerase sigma-70 factor [Chitinophaga sp. sic0106]MBV7533446.1 RNA polymerase sigma-70 factor [Chitinophaga sp. sic0106]